MDLPKRMIRSLKTAVDILVFGTSMVLACLARFEWAIPDHMVALLLVALPAAVFIKYLVLMSFGVPRMAWRCVSLAGLVRMSAALLTGSLILVLLRFTGGLLHDSQPWARFLLIPYGVILIDFALSCLGIIGARVLWRLWTERGERDRWQRSQPELIRAALYGTGHGAILAARAMTSRPHFGVVPVGFLAEEDFKVGLTIHGLPVLGSLDNLKDLAEQHGLRQVLIPWPQNGPAIRQVLQACEGAGLTTRMLAPAQEGGQRIALARLRQVTIEDLLRRPPVRLLGEAVAGVLRGRTVLISGAGGSIGSELCREVCGHAPAQVLLVEQAENNLFQIHRRLQQEFPGVDLVPVIADVCDETRLDRVFDRHRPEVIFHAAAHKHVPMMEWNVGEAIKNNIGGTRLLADLAHDYGVGHFVMISTDKAVRPTSVMGVSKRVAELYLQALGQRSKTRFVAVRFGNVLGSVGSVIPVFQEQIAQGGPVTVTHPDMQRYFMTIPEACQLILEAASLGHGGEIFILDMGEPVKILDLAQDLIRLSGLAVGTDIDIRFTGVRPGEKLFEELSLDEEKAERTRHPRIYIGKLGAGDLARIRRQVDDLLALADSAEDERLRTQLKIIVPEYEPHTPEPAILRKDEPHAAESTNGAAPKNLIVGT